MARAAPPGRRDNTLNGPKFGLWGHPCLAWMVWRCAATTMRSPDAAAERDGSQALYAGGGRGGEPQITTEGSSRAVATRAMIWDQDPLGTAGTSIFGALTSNCPLLAQAPLDPTMERHVCACVEPADPWSDSGETWQRLDGESEHRGPGGDRRPRAAILGRSRKEVGHRGPGGPRRPPRVVVPDLLRLRHQVGPLRRRSSHFAAGWVVDKAIRVWKITTRPLPTGPLGSHSLVAILTIHV